MRTLRPRGINEVLESERDAFYSGNRSILVNFVGKCIVGPDYWGKNLDFNSFY